MTFSELNLDPQISQALAACGYIDPTPVQAQAIPEILLGKDLVASAQTGTGKTAAFVLPALHRLSLNKGNSKPRILILTPTRELASQITLAAEKYGKFLRPHIASLVGGMSYRQQLKELSRPVDIIVATPGRLLDHMENRRVNLSQIEMLILDEADRMLDMGFVDDVTAISNATPNSRQTLLFSATVDNRITQIIKKLLKSPVHIDLSEKTMAPAKIAQAIYHVDNPQHKARLLQHFLTEESIFKAIIFSATKVNADRLAKDLRDQGLSAAALHGDLKQAVRNRTVEQLRRGKVQFVVATDVAARGIDINDLTHVINYDLPKFSEDYVHRIGRTGRAGKEGIAISFALPSDARHVQRIEKYIGQQIERKVIAGLEPTKRTSDSKSDSFKKSRGKKSSGGFRSDSPRKSFSDKKRFSDRSDRPDRSEKRTFSDRPARSEKRSFSDRPERSEKRTFSDRPERSEKRTFSDRPVRSEKRSFSDRPERSEKRTFSDRPARSEKRSFSDRPERSEKRSFSDRPERSEKRSFSDRPERSEKRTFSDRPARSEKRSFSDRPERSEKRTFSDRPARSEKRTFSDKPERKTFGGKKTFSDRSDRPARSEKRTFSDRPEKAKERVFTAKKMFADKPFKRKSAPRTGKPSERSRDDR